MKKRLRKKLQKDNLFPVRLTLILPDSDSEGHHFWKRLEEKVRARRLLVLGTIDDFCVFTDYRPRKWQLVTEADREILRTWLQQQVEVTAITIGALANDAWCRPAHP